MTTSTQQPGTECEKTLHNGADSSPLSAESLERRVYGITSHSQGLVYSRSLVIKIKAPNQRQLPRREQQKAKRGEREKNCDHFVHDDLFIQYSGPNVHR